jgi:hypothetical protein
MGGNQGNHGTKPREGSVMPPICIQSSRRLPPSHAEGPKDTVISAFPAAAPSP